MTTVIFLWPVTFSELHDRSFWSFFTKMTGLPTLWRSHFCDISHYSNVMVTMTGHIRNSGFIKFRVQLENIHYTLRGLWKSSSGPSSSSWSASSSARYFRVDAEEAGKKRKFTCTLIWLFKHFHWLLAHNLLLPSLWCIHVPTDLDLLSKYTATVWVYERGRCGNQGGGNRSEKGSQVGNKRVSYY